MASLVGKLAIGTDVLVNTKDKFKNKKAVVKYVGPLEGMQGELIGVELDTPDGIHSGENKGKRYFKCKEKHGMFLKSKSLTLVDGTPVADLATNETKIKEISKPSLQKKPTTSNNPKAQQKFESISKQSKNKLSRELGEVNIQDFKSQYRAQDRDESQVGKENEELKQQVKDMEEKLQAMKIQSDKIKYATDNNKEEKLKQINDQVKFYKEQKDNFERDKKKMTDKIKALQDELQENAQNNGLLETLSLKLQTVEGKNQNLKQELEKTKTQLRNAKSTMNTQITEGSSGSKNLNEEVEVLNETLILLESDLKEQKEKNQALMKEIQINKEKVSQYTKMETKLKKRQAEVEQLKETVDQYEHAANFAETQTLKIIKKEEELTQANRQLSQYVKKVEKMEFQIKDNKELLAQYDGMILLFEEDMEKLNKQIKDKEVQISELNTILQKYKQKLIGMTQLNDKRSMEKELFQESREEPSSVRQITHSDLYEQKYKDSQKYLQAMSSKFVQSQVQFSEIKNQVGVYMLNLMQALPESFSNKFHPDVIEMIVNLKSTNDKLYLLFDTICQYLRERNEVYAKDNLQLALWMIIVLDKIGIIYGSLLRIETAMATSETEDQISGILSRGLKEEVRKIDIFTSQLLQRFAEENLSSSIDIVAFTEPCEVLDKINFNIQRKFGVEYETRIKLCVETMKVIYRTFETIIDFKMVSELQQNAQVDINIETFVKVTLSYLKECCTNPHLRLRSTMNKYLSGMEFILNIYNEIEENEKVKEIGNLYSADEEIKILKDTLVTTQVYTKELLQDLKDIQYSTTLSRIHYKLPGTVWVEKTKQIKEQLLRVKEISLQKQELQVTVSEAKKKIAILQKEMKDKQNIKQLHQKRIGELQLKVEQANTLEKENKKQAQKMRALEDANNVLAQEIEARTVKIRDFQGKMEKNKSTIDELQTQLIVKDSRKSKTNQVISTEDVANLTIFKNVVKENSILKTLEYKKKVTDLKYSQLLSSSNTKLHPENQATKKASLLRRKALQAMSRLKIFDPRAEAWSNTGTLDNLYLEAGRLNFTKLDKSQQIAEEFKVGRLLIKGSLQNGVLIIGQTKSSILGF